MKTEFKTILNKDVQGFILQHENDDLDKLLLKQNPIAGISARAVVEQISARRKSKEKLPTWYNQEGVIFPPSLNLEQSSSEASASFKASLIAALPVEKKTFADLTGGFGVDSLFFGKVFNRGYLVEPNEELLHISKHNHTLLGVTNLDYMPANAETFIEWDFSQNLDFIYLDPSRRRESRKVFRLTDCEPNVVALQSSLLLRAPVVLIKTSPLLDIQQALRELVCVKQVIVLAIDNEVKELLFLQQSTNVGEPEIVTINQRAGTSSEFVFRISSEKLLNTVASPPLQYLYEPNAAILKAGAFKSIASAFGVQKIQTNTHLYTSDRLVADFPGRIFEIVVLQPNEKQLRKLLPDAKVNVMTRNYPLTPEALKKKLKLKDGGEKYLIGFSEEKKKTIVLAERVN